MRSVAGPSGVNVARTNSCGVSHVVGSALPYRNGDNVIPIDWAIDGAVAASGALSHLGDRTKCR